jgi:hypothetical protein
MNVWAVILALIAIGCLVVAYEGTQNNVFAAVTGKPVSGSVISGTPTTSATTTSAGGSTGVSLPAATSTTTSPGIIV